MYVPGEFYFKAPLYLKFEYRDDAFREIFDLIYYDGKVDNYCPICKKDSIFQSIPDYEKARDQPLTYSVNYLKYFSDFQNEYDVSFFKNRTLKMGFKCERGHGQNSLFEFYTQFNATNDGTKKFFQKIGQYPTLADLNDYKVSKYNKVLTTEQFDELNKSLGLVSHGVGIGAFVYLRRIFEKLVLDTYHLHQKVIDGELGETKFMSMKMDLKIETLKVFLPPFIVENRTLYGLMSKGIHMLSEKECLEKFRTVELGIRLILEEKLLEYEKRNMVEEFKKLNSKS